MAEKEPPANVPSVPPTAVGDPNGHQRAPVELVTDGDAFDSLSMEGMSRLVELERKMRLSAETTLAEALQDIERMQGEATLLAAKKKEEKSILNARHKYQKDLAKKLLEKTKADATQAKVLLDKTNCEATLLLAKTKSVAKQDLDTVKNALATQVEVTETQKNLKKNAQNAKSNITKDLKKMTTKYDNLVRLGELNKSKMSEQNIAMSDWMKTKSDLDDQIKKLGKDLKGATKQVELKVDKKLDHELNMLKLKNENKQLELDLVQVKLQDKLESRKAPPPATKTTKAKAQGPLTLMEKKEFESHKAELKRISKENDATRAKLKKENKAADIRSNLGFAANLMQNRTNGGMWQTGLVADVSSCLVFVFYVLLRDTNTLFRILVIF